MLRVLLVDRDAVRIDRVNARLERVHGRDLDLQVEGRTELAAGWLERQPFDIVLLAVEASADWAIELATLRAAAGQTPVVLLVDANFTEPPERVRAAGAAEVVRAGDDVPDDLPRLLDSVIARWPLELRLSELQQQRDQRAELLESVLAVVERPVLIANAAGEITSASRRCADLFSGYAQELRGVSLNDLVAREDRSRFATFTGHLSDREWVESERFRLTTQPAGQTMPIRGTAVHATPEGAWTVLAFDDTASGARRLPEDAATHVPVGLFQLLGLDDVREALGDHWPELESRVYRVVERVLDDNLMIHDHFWRNHDGDYLVLFERCTREQATERARELVRRIKAAVIGAHELKSAFDTNEHLDESHAAAVGDVRLTMSEIPLEPGMLQREAEPCSIIEKKLEAVRARAREQLRVQLAGLRGQLPGRHNAARTRSGTASPLLFLDMAAPHRERLAALTRQAEHDADLLLEIDAFHLDRHADLLAGGGSANGLAVVDVHAASLACKRSRARYRELCSRRSAAVHGRMVFNIVGIQPGTYAPRIRRMASALAPLARFVGLQLTRPKPDAVDLKQAGIPLVACDYSEIAPMMATRPDQLARFVRFVHDHKARLVLRRVPQSMEREMAETLSVDLISGC